MPMDLFLLVPLADRVKFSLQVSILIFFDLTFASPYEEDDCDDQEEKNQRQEDSDPCDSTLAILVSFMTTVIFFEARRWVSRLITVEPVVCIELLVCESIVGLFMLIRPLRS